MAEKSDRARREEEILKFWQENKIFEKTLEKPSPKGEFVFYDGPPFATGLPHAGSLLSSVIKDVIPRYKTMRGYNVRRRWGWDCHGLPIENMIEKELGLKDKTEIEGKVGIKTFNETCRASVLRFADEWKKYVDRIGRWVEYDNAYKTMDNSYVESVWNALSKINERGLLYEGRKVLLYCPHCQTPIAKAEVAMDNSYRDVTEESVYVKFPIKNFAKAYFLAWTTTPWTLPGNLALAVGPDMDYVEAKVGDEIYVLSKNKLALLPEHEIVAEHKGREMLGMGYEPLYRLTDDTKAYKVYTGDFVTEEDGTGIVHTAVLYGEDDYNLGLREGLPQVPMLDERAHFNSAAPEFIRDQYFKKAEKAIKEDLELRGLMFKRENNTHSYPHCHRCGTALLYNALSSWFINIQKIKDKMISLNEKINWVPGHLKHGRFLNIVEGAPDWTISRNRYWAAPLPIWKDVDGNITLISSLEELKKYTKKSGNRYFLMRHGEAGHNVKNILDLEGDPNNHLTENGKSQVKSAKVGEPDLVFCSPFLRSRETAGIISKDFKTDERLIEMRPGESQEEMRKRMLNFMFEIEGKYKDKHILIVSHQGPINALNGEMPNTAEVSQFDFAPFPHNDNYELDLHRPYIDEIKLEKDGKPLKRIPEVIDGWVESASMPFAEYHYPFENKRVFEGRSPGDFVAEYIAQTRTWFYYMHAISVALFDNIAFKNVVTTGNVLARDGSKMSKSKGNYTDPLILIDEISADAFRYYLMSSVVMQAEDASFRDEEVKDVQQRVINILENSFKFFELYADKTPTSDQSKNVLDRWILARLGELNKDITAGLDGYDTVRASRSIKDFVTDLSTWYIRRSRSRFKDGDNEALATARFVFLQLSKLIAPITPYIAEEIYQKVRDGSDPESVHLCEWPISRQGFVGQTLRKLFSRRDSILSDMEEVRRIVSLALEQRQKANIKVRQPLQKLDVKDPKLTAEYLEIIKDEINVKDIVVNKDLETEVKLDTTLTPELEEEGKVRDVVRTIQDWRKEQGLKPGESAKYETSDEFLLKHKEEIEKLTNVELSYLHN